MSDSVNDTATSFVDECSSMGTLRLPEIVLEACLDLVEIRIPGYRYR
jgi:hypothetical protein